MSDRYDPSKVEPKWQKKWEEARIYEVDLRAAKNPYYAAVMFPYPSGDKLHVGHWYNFAPADSFARYMRLKGKDVFTPMGFDAFGLPAENYAVKTGVHPKESIGENTKTMTEQLRRIGCMYDWSKTVNTSEPSYYRWTQWVFLQMFKNGLAYRKEATVNFCPSCKTVLANEQVHEGNCDRCESEVVQKPLTQWYWKITAFAERLLAGLRDLDWPIKTKVMQENWIGRKEGVFITSRLKGTDYTFEVWDSVPQTYMAQTFTVIAPDHPDLPKLMKGRPEERGVLEFAERMRKVKIAKRFNPDEDLEGVFTGIFVDDPFGHGDLPLWVASYVVMEYGSGIVHCSAHDERDFAFAKKCGIPLRPVMFPADSMAAEKIRSLEYCYAKDPEAIMEQPEVFRGRKWGEVREDIIDHLVQKMKIARKAVNYRLRDWCISRQRYWGAPIPIVYDPKGNPHPVPDEHLPWMLPVDVDFRPDGTAPLARSKELRERTERIFGKGWTPEVDTMDTFVCSSFYELRYLAEDSQMEFVPKDIAKKWMPVCMYIGGAEHACMHLIFARFVTMVLCDLGYIACEEPFRGLVHQGVITSHGAKMSKSKGNVVSPDGFVERYGSDVFRMYLMFMGPFTEGGDWSDTGIKGVDRFVQRIWKMFGGKKMTGGPVSPAGPEGPAGRGTKMKKESKEVQRKLHTTIKKVGEDIEKMHFNTAISALMELLNLFEKEEGISLDTAKTFAILLAPMAPHLADELWEITGGGGFVIEQSWPTYDANLLVTDTVTIVVQVNGKVRAQMTVPADIVEADVIAQAKEQENVRKFLAGKVIKKEIYVAGRLVSFVV